RAPRAATERPGRRTPGPAVVPALRVPPPDGVVPPAGPGRPPGPGPAPLPSPGRAGVRRGREDAGIAGVGVRAAGLGVLRPGRIVRVRTGSEVRPLREDRRTGSGPPRPPS